MGRLCVFEGTDNVGKSALSLALSNALSEDGEDCILLSFPGQEQRGALGAHVYELHHKPKTFGVSQIEPASLQLLHVAAHIDLVNRRILPSLRQEKTVILDRFWWSTYVYGICSGISPEILDATIAVEKLAWDGVVPSLVFLVERNVDGQGPSDPVVLQYRRLAEAEARSYPVRTIDNSGSLNDALALVRRSLAATTVESPQQMRLPLRGTTAPQVFKTVAPAEPTEVFDTYWRFAAERQEIFFKRAAMKPAPWTDDPILREYRFTNAYRASDRVSQFLIREVIYSRDYSRADTFFRILLFKIFNRVETWECLEQAFGEITHSDFDRDSYDQVLTEAMATGPIFSSAYIMPSGSKAFPTRRKHRAFLWLLEQMMEDEAYLRICEAGSMARAFEILVSYPMIGDFLGYQFVTDLNYSRLTDFSEMEFVVAGPGARDGIHKCFRSLGGLSSSDIIRVVADLQEGEFERRGIEFKSLCGRSLQLIDCQNLFCEVDKYARKKHPDFQGRQNRHRIKRRFTASYQPIPFFFPPKWKLEPQLGPDYLP